MDKIELGRLLETYWQEYRTRTTRLARVDIAARWWRLSLTRPEVTAPVAAGWARLGYLPEEAEVLIADGLTPATVAKMERHAELAAGGPEALVAQRIQQMVELGEIVDPAEVIRVQDPTDPTREIITIRDEQ